MACANALMHHRRLQRLKKSSHSGRPEASTSGGSSEVRILPADESSTDTGRDSPSNFHYVNQQTDDESEPLLSDASDINHYDINLQRHANSGKIPLPPPKIINITKYLAGFRLTRGKYIFFLLQITGTDPIMKVCSTTSQRSLKWARWLPCFSTKEVVLPSTCA